MPNRGKTYSLDDLIAAYRLLGVEPGDVVLVAGNVGRLGSFEVDGKDATAQAHVSALQAIIGTGGTIVVPTATLNLCNSETPFDPDTTPGFRMGVISEYVRTRPGARRSFHPFVSYAALGDRADEITQNVARHAFGPETPEARMIALGARHIALGISPRLTTATNHHLEFTIGVPYRYVREYIHPVVRAGAVRHEPFYQHVWYRGVERDANRKLFERFAAVHPLREARAGQGRMTSYSMADFFKTGLRIFLDDMYVWCASEPEHKPYRDWM